MRVYMMPTPREALTDTTNAIHQTVLRLKSSLVQFDIELVDTPDSADLIVGHAGQGGSGPVDVAHCHGLYPTANRKSEAWHWAANQSVISNLMTAREITVPSQWVAEILRRDMNVDPHVIGWAVDAEEWSDANPQGYVLWNKTRQDDVCDPTPIEQLAHRVPKMKFVSTFGTPSSNLEITGRRIVPEMKKIILGAEVYLATTKETFGIGTLEAMAAGIPILGYRWGGTADIVEHGITGYLVEPGDYEGLVEGLEFCLKHRRVLGANAQKVARTYTWNRVAESIAGVYRKALASKPEVKVSVVIPLHNYENYVTEAIDSVLAQKASFPFELIVVDDKSTDGSVRAAKKVLKTATIPTKLISLPENRGVAQTRNHGISQAKGEYIVCLDADDKIGDSNFLQTLATALDRDRSLGIAFSSLQLMNENGELGSVSQWPKGYQFDRQVAGHNQVPTCCMFRKEAWRRALGYRTRYQPAEDANFWLRIGSLGYRGKHVTEAPMFHYRLHSKSLTTTIRQGAEKEPDWRSEFSWVQTNQRPFASDGTPRMNRFSWPVRNYDRPKVSFVVPVGPGHEEYVIDALDSIHAQTEHSWECIVVNDSGSTLTLPSWVKEIETSGKIGAAAARNLGIKAASAPFIAFLDADDMIHTQFLERSLQIASGKKRYSYTDWVSLNKDGMFENHRTPEYRPEDVFQKTSLHSINVVIQKEWLLDVGGFDESYPSWEDVDLFMKLALKGYCGQRVPEPLVLYRYPTGSLRESGELIKSELKSRLFETYQPLVEGKTMGCCGDVEKKVRKPLPALNGSSEDSIRVVYDGSYAPSARQTLIGQATRQNYGSRARGDVFFIWRADFEAMPDHFSLAGMSYDEVIRTEIPAEPVLR